MTCLFCGKPCHPPNQLISKRREMHIGCLLTAYDKERQDRIQDNRILLSQLDAARAVVEAQRSNLEELRTLLLGDKWTQANADNLSPLSNLSMLLREYEREHNWKTDEDLDATREFVVDIREFLAKLRAALEGVEPEGEGQKAESTRQ